MQAVSSATAVQTHLFHGDLRTSLRQQGVRLMRSSSGVPRTARPVGRVTASVPFSPPKVCNLKSSLTLLRRYSYAMRISREGKNTMPRFERAPLATVVIQTER